MSGIWKYQDLLPAIAPEHRVSLGEGNTPLLKSIAIAKQLGLKNLYFKLENLNPTGSYKDRFAAMAISQARAKKFNAILATSSGNTGAALAAYAARAGLKCIICLVDGAPFGKVQQMGVYGAELIMMKGFGLKEALTRELMGHLSLLSHKHPVSLEISAYCFSPIGMAGVQSISFELAEALPALKHVFVPAGGGGLFLSVLRGFKKWKANKNPLVGPKLYCVQPEGNDTIASVLAGEKKLQGLSGSTTRISGLQVPNLLDASEICQQAKHFPVHGLTVQDQEVFRFQEMLAQQEGIYCEPAGAVALVGLKKALLQGEIKADDPVVCLITGHGFKDSNALDQIYKKEDCLYTQDMLQTSIALTTKINT